MTSAIDIANFALSDLGAGRITSLAASTEEAILANLFYETIRKKCLSSYGWSFARKRASLAASATAPAFRYAYAYPIPSDFLTLIQAGEYYPPYNYDTVVNNENQEYVIESGEILTDLTAPLKIKYIFDNNDASTFSTPFIMYVAAELAVAMSEKITQSTTKKQLLMGVAEKAFLHAVKNDRKQNPPATLGSGSWVDSRQNYYGGF